MARVRVLYLLGVVFGVATTTWAGSSIDIGELQQRGGGSIKLMVMRDQDSRTLNGAAIACYDEHVIRSVHLFGLHRAELERLRKLIDATLAALDKK